MKIRTCVRRCSAERSMFTRPPICKVGHLEVPAAALTHRFVREARLVLKVFSRPDCTLKERGVIATANEIGRPQCQLYGWLKDVSTHVDNTGWIYFLLLRGASFVTACGTSLLVKAGDVVRLNDYCPHSTYDDQPSVALFWGPVGKPNDLAARMHLARGLAQLACDQYEAPRVMSKFRVLVAGECFAWATSWDEARRMEVRDVARHNAMVIRCSVARCSRRAWKLDHSFPYQWEHNRCIKHAALASNSN